MIPRDCTTCAYADMDGAAMPFTERCRACLSADAAMPSWSPDASVEVPNLVQKIGDEAVEDAFDERRIDIIGPNGNEGLHYGHAETFDAGPLGGGDIYEADKAAAAGPGAYPRVIAEFPMPNISKDDLLAFKHYWSSMVTSVTPEPEVVTADAIHVQVDPIVESVRAKLLQRSQVGIKKDGAMLDRKDLSELDWLKHAQEEAMDLCNYLERLIQDKAKGSTKDEDGTML